jgi:hypothetical protein
VGFVLYAFQTPFSSLYNDTLLSAWSRKKEHTEQEAFANKMIEEALYCTKYQQTI